MLHALHDELISYGSPPAMTVPDPAAIGLSIRIAYAGEELHFLSTVATFGAAFDLTLDEIVMETYFPADDRTAAALKSLAIVTTSGRANEPAVHTRTAG